MSDVREQVARYLHRGWYSVPLLPRSKKPIRADWPQLRIGSEDIKTAFSPKDNVGLILGEPSGWLIDVDLDCDEAIELADQFLPSTPAITGRPSSPRSHRWYIAAGAITQKHSDPNDGSMIVELRSTGTQTAVGPSVHPDGEVYETLEPEPLVVPAPMLAACVRALAEAVCMKRGTGSQRPKSKSQPVERSHLAGTDVEQRAITYLHAMPPAVSGSGGHSLTYAAATALVHGFGIEPSVALQILTEHYNPRCDPPWSDKELQHKIDQASSKPHDRPFGWLRGEQLSDALEEVDLSQFKFRSSTLSAFRIRVGRSGFC